MKGSPRIVLIVAILASFVAFLDGSIVNVALPSILEDLGGGLATQLWVVDAYLLTLGSLILLAGSLSDSFGRVRVLRAGLIIFGIASLACAFAPTDGFLIGARAVQGVGAALLVPSSLAIITATFDGAARSKAIGTWTGWTGTAFIVGALLGGVIVDTIGWRWIFGINVLPIAVTLALMMKLSDIPGFEKRVPIDYPGAILGALGLAGPVFALIEQDRLGWWHPAVILPLVLGLICLGAYIWWEGRAPNPMMPLPLFRIRNFGVGNIATAFIYGALSLGLLGVTLFLQEVEGFSATVAGLASLPTALISLFLAGTFGGLSGKYGPRLFMTVGPLIAAAGFFWMVSAAAPINFWLQILPGMILFGLGLAVTVAPLTAAILGAVPTAKSGIGSAINNAVSRVAGLIAIAFAGTIIAGTFDTEGFHRVVIVAGILLVLGGVTSLIGITNKGLNKQPTSLPAASTSN